MIVKDAQAQLEALDIPQEPQQKISHFHNFIASLSGGKADQICIFCAGKIGLAMHTELYMRMVEADCFADNDPQKCGKSYHNIPCLSLAQLKKKAKNTLVIVSSLAADEIVAALTQQGFPYVVSYKEVCPQMNLAPATRWLHKLKPCGTPITPSQEKLMWQYNRMIYDLCSHFSQP